ncbi:branched-chain amino acid transport system II carrier protein [Oribacterium sp. WCC10]|uniref:branched-chain amino acid transport system II carrier protein n=1 Tax=Oribacterium sp. WCC10 TaxID=1855343 RepID=UPI0008EBA2B2|nr:branched-chain amino acid transport system II carrier protein [Oribacterium sp. WCC10]SFG44513.1 branched-chain amino acid:cation transporter, LIVCS family [Oribacterium sp. WCC10]
MKSKLTFGELITITSMLFGLFFGAGNLIFPAYMGQMSGANVYSSLLGFLVTAVGMPLLAVISLALTGSNGLLDLSQKVGKRFGYIFTVALYLAIGPFFAAPRCLTVPFEIGIKPMIPDGMNPKLILFIFTTLVYGLMLWFSLRPGNILTWIGKILNPVFITVLGLLLAIALFQPEASIHVFEAEGVYAGSPFVQGILDGYNTMDILAGLAFGIIVVDVVKKQGISDPNHIAGNTIKAGFFSCGFMGVIYFLVSLAGAESRAYASLSDNGGAVLSDISAHYFPGFGSVMLTVIVFFACLKTAVGLMTSCAETFSGIFPGVLSYNKWAILFSTVTYIVSNAGLSSIIKISVPVLMMLYPIAITLTLLSVFGGFFKHDHTVVVSVMTMAVISSVFDFIKALPADWINAIGANAIIGFLDAHLPLFSLGFGWVVPTAVGLLIALVYNTSKKTKAS